MLVLVGEEGHCSHSLTAMVHIRTGPHPAPAHCPLGRNKEEKLDEEHCFDSFSRFPLGNEGNKLALRMGFSGCWERGREAGGGIHQRKGTVLPRAGIPCNVSGLPRCGMGSSCDY